MLPIPGRAHFAALTEAARSIGLTVTLGFTNALEDGRVSVLKLVKWDAHEVKPDAPSPDAAVAPAAV